jgi:MraZ protein
MDVTFSEVSYVGSFQHQLDGRNRVTVPSGWRVEGDDQNYYMAWPHPEGCIAVYPPEMQKEFREKSRLIKQSDLQGQRLLREFFGTAHMFGCDKQGRILIPEGLLGHAAITKSVVMVGMGRSFQIWSAARFLPPENAQFNLLDAMEKLGF